MDYAGLTRLLIRIAGLWGIAGAIGNMPRAMEWLLHRDPDAPLVSITGALGSLLVPLTIGALLFALADPIANRCFAPRASVSGSAEASKVEAAALCVLGFYLLCYAVFDAVYVLAKTQLYYAYVQRTGYPAPPILPGDFATLCESGVKLLFAISLIVFSRGIIALKDRILSLRGFAGDD